MKLFCMKDLFTDKKVEVYIEEKKRDLKKAVEEFPEKNLMENDLDTMVTQLFNSAMAMTNVLKKENAVKEIIGQGARYTIPYTGTLEYFGLIPPKLPAETPCVAELTINELVIEVEAREEERNEKLIHQLALIAECMCQLDEELTRYNAGLPELIRNWVVERKEKAESHHPYEA